MADLHPPRKKQVQIHNDRLLLWELRQTRWQINWQIYPPGKWQFEINTDTLLLWELRQTRWQINPPKWWFEIHNDTFLPWELTQVADQVADLPPRQWWFEIHNDRLLLWELRQTMWQIKWQIYPHPSGNGNLRFILKDSYLGQHRQTSWQINWQIYLPGNDTLRLILIDCYSESSGRPGGRASGRSTPQKWWIGIHTDRFLLWELRQINPPGKQQFQIHTDRYLL